MMVVVGVGDCGLSRQPEDVLITYALGSCMAVAIHDPISRVGGLLHLMLPDSTIDPEKARANPYMFADTGIPILFRRAYELGADRRRLRISLAGGASIMDDSGVFDIGRRNHTAARRILWKAGLMVSGESVGGKQARTVRLEVATGKVWFRAPGMEEQPIPELAPRMPREVNNGVPNSHRG